MISGLEIRETVLDVNDIFVDCNWVATGWQ